MKIFRIPTLTNISDKIVQLRIAKRGKNVSKYIQYPQNNLNKECYDLLESGSTGIANYLKHNKMSLKITSEHISQQDGNNEFLRFALFGLKNKENPLMVQNIPLPTNATYKAVAEQRIMLPVPGEDMEIFRNVRSEREDAPLRYIYRIISNMVEQIKQGNGKKR